MNTEEQVQWEVEEILSDRIISGKTRYEVKWVGYENTTFEPLHNLNHCNDALQTFLREKKQTQRLTTDNFFAYDSNWVEPRVECILNVRSVNNEQEYHVKWVGEEALTWEPLRNIDNNLDLIHECLFSNLIGAGAVEQFDQHDLEVQAILGLENDNQPNFNPMDYFNEAGILEAFANLAHPEVNVDLDMILNNNQLNELFAINDQQFQSIFEEIVNNEEEVQLQGDLETSMDVEDVANILVNLSNILFN